MTITVRIAQRLRAIRDQAAPKKPVTCGEFIDARAIANAVARHVSCAAAANAEGKADQCGAL